MHQIKKNINLHNCSHLVGNNTETKFTGFFLSCHAGLIVVMQFFLLAEIQNIRFLS